MTPDAGLPGLAALAFPSESVARWRTVLALAAGPLTFDELRTRLELPQSTLNRNLTKLSDEGWVREEPARTFRLTPVGDGLATALEDTEEVLAVFEALAAYPDAVPADEFDFGLHRLADAPVTIAGDDDPYRVVNRVRDRLGEATVVRGVRPVFMPAYIGVVGEIARSEGGDVLGMVPSHQLEAALADDDFDMGTLPYGDAIEFRVWDGDIDYALAVLDDDLVLLTCDHAGGVPDLLVESRDPAVRRWAHGRIQAIYERSDPVSERV
jgi:predicted transcriptional regulator